MSESEKTPDAALAKAATHLRATLGKANVLDGDATESYACSGAWPTLVALPTSADQVAATLALAAEHALSVVPWGHGTRQALGYPPRSCDLVVSLERLNRVVAYDPADLTITVEAGITHDGLAAELAKARQMLPLDVPEPARATLGGTLATGLTGLRRARYGAPRDLTLGLRVVDASGVMTRTGGRVVKNVTGYDMTKLYLGSLGSLGILVEASFKLAPLPESEATLLGTFPSPRLAFDIAAQCTALPLVPAAVAVLTTDALAPLDATLPTTPQRVLLAVRFAGHRAAIERALSQVQALEGETTLHADTWVPLDETDTQTFWAEADDFTRIDTGIETELSAKLRVSALPMECARVTQTAQAIAREHALDLSWIADTTTGICLMRLASRETSSPPTPEQQREFGASLGAIHQALVFRWRNAVILNCPRKYKALLPVWGATSPALDMMREVKRRFDPQERLNPGRFVGGI